MSEHTAGPWEAEGDNGEVFADFDGRKAVVARAYAWDGNGKHMDRHDALRSGRAFVQHANARLIAAAPELLEALTKLIGIVQNTFGGGYDIHGEKRPWLVEAETAIAKARGEA